MSVNDNTCTDVTKMGTPAAPTPTPKVGDRVCGLFNREDPSSRVEGVLMEMLTGPRTSLLSLDSGATIHVWTDTLQLLVDKPAAAEPAPAASGVAAEAPLPAEAIADPAEDPIYPVKGLIDYNRPIEDADGFPARLIATVDSDHPYVVVVSGDDYTREAVDQFNDDGISASGNFELRNALTVPDVLWGVLVKNADNEIFFIEETFATEEAARKLRPDDRVVAVVPVYPNGKTEPAPVAAPQEAAPETGGDAKKDGGLESISLNIYGYGNRTIRRGDVLRAYRRGYDTRTVTVLKLRHDSRKAVYVEPMDGSNPYWALNKNLRLNG